MSNGNHGHRSQTDSSMLYPVYVCWESYPSNSYHSHLWLDYSVGQQLSIFRIQNLNVLSIGFLSIDYKPVVDEPHLDEIAVLAVVKRAEALQRCIPKYIPRSGIKREATTARGNVGVKCCIKLSCAVQEYGGVRQQYRNTPCPDRYPCAS